MWRRNRRKRPSNSVVVEPPTKIPKVTGIYLEDTTPVRTIEVCPIAEDTTIEYLRGYFESATGPVDNVIIVRKLVNGSDKTMAYVTFTIPEDAAKLICDTNLTCNNKFTIKEAPNAYQPKINPNTVKLEQINDDCLLHIISYLDLVDVANLGETCVRMKAVTRPSLEKYKHFSFGTNTGDSSINESSIPAILKGIGKYIRSLEVHGLHDLEPNILNVLSEHCPKINKMKIVEPSGSLCWNSFKTKKSPFKNLKILKIQDCGLFDNSLRAICSGLKLKSLILTDCRNIRGTFLSKQNRFKVLKLQYTSTSVRNGSIDQILRQDNLFDCQKRNQLTIFATNISGNSYTRFLQDSGDVIHNIQELELDFSNFTGDLSELIALRRLTQLTKFKVTRNFSPNSTFPKFNEFVQILSEIDTLESLDVGRVNILAETWQHLSRIRNLRNLRLKILYVNEDQFYATFQQHLPNIKELSIEDINNWNANVNENIRRLITSHQNLEYFSYNFSNINFLQLFLVNLRETRRKPIKIGVPNDLIAKIPWEDELITLTERK